MPEQRNSKLQLPLRNTNLKKKKKKKRKEASSIDSKLKEKPMSVSPISQLPSQDPGQTQLPDLRSIGKKGGDHCSRGDKKTKKRQKDSKNLLSEAHTTSDNEVSAQVTDLGIQARESLRWEGVLQDPLEEAKRLERYRANRRQRYITHREALLKEAHHLKQAKP